MRPLTARFIAEATSGRVVAGDPSRVFTALSSDSRTTPPGALFVPLSGPRFDGHAFIADVLVRGAGGAFLETARADALVPSLLAGEAPLIAVPDVLRALGDLARALRDLHPGRFVAITGSSGKTTVKELVSAALSAFGPVAKTPGNLNNQIGLPLTLGQTDGHERHVVLELGMSAPGEIAHLAHLARPDVTVVTMAAEAHLASFSSVDGIADAKCELFAHQPAAAVAVANADDPRILGRASALAGERLVTWGRAEGATVRVVARHLTLGAGAAPRLAVELKVGIPNIGTPTISLQLQTMALHDAENAAAAIAVVVALGLDVHAAATALEAGFRPAPHRMNALTPRAGLLVLDDAYNANPASMRGALATVAALADLQPRARRVLVLGTMHELGPDSARLHRELGAAAGALAPIFVLATGPEAASLVAGVSAVAPEAHVRAVPDLDDGLAQLHDLAATATPDAPLHVLLKGSRAERLERALSALGVPPAPDKLQGGA